MSEQSKPQEKEDASRRGFLKIAIGTLGALYALILGIPFLRTIISSEPLKKLSFTEVGDFHSLPIGQPTDLNFEVLSTDAYLSQKVTRAVWVVKHSDIEASVFSPICTHLGCHYKWNPQTRHFECPCHGSVFTISGQVIGGPAPRPLDTLPYKIQDGKLYVEWERFKVGISEKVRV
jgi:menaquinol-cytochrome c reductase iron-sulfur subunit